MDSHRKAEITQRAAAVQLVVFDIDGVLTDGRLYFDDDGREFKSFDVRDGLGIKMVQACGIQTAAITGRKSPAVTHRMQQLGIGKVLSGRSDKRPALQEVIDELQVDLQQTAYLGDDIVDIPAMQAVGLAAAVGDAHAAVIAAAHWQTTAHGGRGAARELCEFILSAQGKLDRALDHYLAGEHIS